MKRWLGYVAFQMQRARFEQVPVSAPDENRGILVSREQLQEWVSFAIAKGRADAIDAAQPTASAFIDWVARRAGLIIPRSEDLFAFTHLSFQEYFAAWFLSEQITGPNWNRPGRQPSPLGVGADLASLQAAITHSGWHETFVLLFELLASRGEWSDEVLSLLFEPLLDFSEDFHSAFPDGLTDSTDAERMRWESLFAQSKLAVALALDTHAGLSVEMRLRACTAAWQTEILSLTVDEGVRRAAEGIDGDSDERLATEWWTVSQERRNRWRLPEDLTSADANGRSIGLEALKHVSGPPAPIRLYMPERGGRSFLAHVSANASLLSRVYWLHVPLDDASGTSGVTEAFASTHWPRLRVLRLRGGQLNEHSAQQLAEAIARCSELRCLIVNKTYGIGRVFTALARFVQPTRLTYLSFGGLELTHDDIKAMSVCDPVLRRLTTLDLSSTGVTDAGVKALADPDSALKGLTTLNLSNTRVTDAGVKALADPASALKGLTTLDLYGTGVTEAGLKALADPASALKGLTTLDLRDTRVTDAGVKALADPASALKGLTTLDLSGTGVTDAGLKALADPASALKGLTTLDLNGTGVTDAGLKALADPASALKGLTTLSLSGTGVTDAGLKALADPASALKGLTTLSLNGTGVTEAGLKALADPASALKGLTTLSLSFTGVTDAGVKALKSARPTLRVHN
ncbi:MAG: hypothetical protein QM770_16935 [Tepidisphaeraceae bacterium]